MVDTSDRPARVIALLNQKGGVGKTTTSVNLAAAMARLNARTLLVDLDPQAHATLHLGLGPEDLHGTIYDLLHSPEEDPRQVIIAARENLGVLPSETDLAAAEVELGMADDRHGRLARVLGHVAHDYDLVLIDCPPALGMLTINALVAADEVIIPMQAHFLSLQGVGKLLETVSLVTHEINPRLKVTGVVLCMFDSQATHTQEVVADIEAFFESSREQPVAWREARLLRPAIRRNVKLAECPSFGKTIFDYAPAAAGAEDYTALARAIMAGGPGATPSRDGSRTDEREPEPPTIEVMTSACERISD